jgi:hypothetical protein
MATWNIGSVSDEIFNLVTDIPTSISGATLKNIISRKLSYINTFLGTSIGSNSIDEQYQEPLINLSISQLMGFIDVQDTSSQNIKLGELSVGDSNSTDLASADFFLNQGMEELKELKSRFGYFKALG